MTPLELIKTGILNGSLQQVEEGYTALTGEAVTKKVVTKAKPVSKKPTPYQEEEETDEVIEDPDDPFKVQIRSHHKQNTRELEDGTIQTEARKEPVDLNKIGAFNMFSDDGTEEVENREGDKGLYVKPLEPRREAVKKVTAKCVECLKTFKVLPIHQMEGSFTCQKCLKGKRKR